MVFASFPCTIYMHQKTWVGKGTRVGYTWVNKIHYKMINSCQTQLEMVIRVFHQFHTNKSLYQATTVSGSSKSLESSCTSWTSPMREEYVVTSSPTAVCVCEQCACAWRDNITLTCHAYNLCYTFHLWETTKLLVNCKLTYSSNYWQPTSTIDKFHFIQVYTK